MYYLYITRLYIKSTNPILSISQYSPPLLPGISERDLHLLVSAAAQLFDVDRRDHQRSVDTLERAYLTPIPGGNFDNVDRLASIYPFINTTSYRFVNYF